MRRIIKHLSKKGARLFRNNMGETWIGKSQYIRKTDFYKCEVGDVIIRKARRFHAGLAEGSSDLIGFTPVKITADMVGKEIAVFTAIETKASEKEAISASRSGQKREKQQQNFCNYVSLNGGLAGFAGSEEQSELLISSDNLFSGSLSPTGKKI